LIDVIIVIKMGAKMSIEERQQRQASRDARRIARREYEQQRNLMRDNMKAQRRANKAAKHNNEIYFTEAVIVEPPTAVVLCVEPIYACRQAEPTVVNSTAYVGGQ
jgi:hypothetical protein